jgi:hypothetical protein
VGTVWRQGWVFQKRQCAKCQWTARTTTHIADKALARAHAHLRGYYSLLHYSTETYAGLDQATGRGKYGKHTGPGRSTGKNLTLPLSGASNHPSVTSRQRKRRITSHYIDTSGKDSTFTQERRALAGTKQGRHLYRRIWLVARAPSQ